MTHIPEGYARNAVEAIAKMRRQGMADGTWPAHSVEMWRRLADEATLRQEAGEELDAIGREALALFPPEAP